MTLGITVKRHWEVNAGSASRQGKLLSTISRQPATSTVYRTKTIYLEDAGLRHIMNQHRGDFERKFNAKGENAVANFKHNTVTRGDTCTFGFQSNPSGGFDVCYKIDNRSYLQLVVSDSGYIVTAHPRRKAKQSDWVSRKIKEKKE